MADLDDVSDTLAGICAGILYPNGTEEPSAVTAGVRVFAGWPLRSQLDADLALGNAQVSVYPSKQEQNTTRYQLKWITRSVNAPTLTLTLADQSVTVDGAIPPATNPHNVMVFANGKPYVYAVQIADTLVSIAAALATLMGADIFGVGSTGPVITVPPSVRLTAARVGITGTMVREIARQDRVFQITLWAPTPLIRTALAKAIDPALKAMFFICLPDGSSGRMIYRNSAISDEGQKVRIYRRDLFYSVEYPTLEVATATEVVAFEQQISASMPDGSSQPVTTIYE